MLRLDEIDRETGLFVDPYPHIVVDDVLDETVGLNSDFPSHDRFGPTIRMDGDLTAGDTEYEALIENSSFYRDMHRQVYSNVFIEKFLDLFRPEISRAFEDGQLLSDPFKLKIVPEPIEMRVSGRAFVGGDDPFLYPRFDIGYGGVGYGSHNGGRGVHIDNLPRLISILVFLNSPKSMVGGTHRLYGLRGSEPVLEKIYQPKAGLLIASLQSNRAFHDVEPVVSIVGERRAFYIAVSCSEPIWKKEFDTKLSELSKNRYDPSPPLNTKGVIKNIVSGFRSSRVLKNLNS